MKKLSDILKNIVTIEVTGELDYSVSNISFDSRNIAEGDLFVAVKGTNVDGHDYIDLAIDKGAKCIVYEDEPLIFKKNLTYIKVNNSAQVLGKLVSNYYNNPSMAKPATYSNPKRQTSGNLPAALAVAIFVGRSGSLTGITFTSISG